MTCFSDEFSDASFLTQDRAAVASSPDASTGQLAGRLVALLDGEHEAPAVDIRDVHSGEQLGSAPHELPHG